MSIFKKFAAPLLAVALVAVMGVSLLSNTRHAEAAVTAGAVTSTSLVAGATATYTFNFTGSATTNLTSLQVTFPTLFTVPASPVVTVTGAGTACTVISAVSAGGVVGVGITGVCNPTAAVVTVAGVVNPAAGTYTANAVQSTTAGFAAATSLAADVALVAEANGFVITAALQPTAVAFSGASQAAGATTTWTITGVGSTAGNITSTTIAFPAGFVMGLNPTATVSNGTTACLSPSAVNTANVVVVTVTSCANAGNTTITTTIAGVTNPGAATVAAAGFTMKTSTDTTAGVDTAAEVISGTAGNNIRLVLTTTAAKCTSTPDLSGIAYSAGDASAPDVLADGSVANFLCAIVTDSTNAVLGNIPVTFTVSSGVVSTGTAKTVVAVTTNTGVATTNYRGGGGIAGTDTAIASNSTLNAVGTMAIDLTAPSGTTASKVAITAPTQLAVSPSQTNVSPGYTSPQTQTNFAVQVTDSAGLGVNGQVVLVSVDKGAVVAGHGAVCTTAKAATVTTATGVLTVGGTSQAGSIQLTYCGNQLDAPGQATITVSNISTAMANATTTIATAGRPGKVAATFTNGVIAVVVTDANGNNVADNTPVLFTISSTAGAVSNTCNLTANGKASSAVSLNAGSGSVIVSAGYNESGATATCTAGNTGAQVVSSVVNIGTVATPPNTVPAAGAGTFASAPVYSASKLAQVVFNGGTLVQLDAALVAAKASGAWAQDSKGVFHLYVVGGGFVNDGFKAAFPTGFAGVTAMTVVG